MESDSSPILDMIQRLSNERQALYRLKWSRRQAREYSQRIHDLDKEIQDLWQARRIELAGAAAPGWSVSRGSYHSSVEAAAAHSAGDPEEVYEVTHLAEALDQVGVSIIREVLAELREEREQQQEVVPLRKVLARRGKTLQWTDNRRGRSISQVVNISPY